MLNKEEDALSQNLEALFCGTELSVVIVPPYHTLWPNQAASVPPAQSRLLQGRPGHRAILHRQGCQFGPDWQWLLRQVQHRKRLHPVAEWGTGAKELTSGEMDSVSS